jgi:hypothetical protein
MNRELATFVLCLALGVLSVDYPTWLDSNFVYALVLFVSGVVTAYFTAKFNAAFNSKEKDGE